LYGDSTVLSTISAIVGAAVPLPTDPTPARPPLTRERVLACALVLADAGGIDAVTIRSLAAALGVKPMSVYHHVASKGAILDGVVDLVFAEMQVPPGDGDPWRDQIAGRAQAMRRVLRAHPWAIGLLESRSTPGPATLRHHEAATRTLREAGFSVQMTAHASALIDSFVSGFALQEAARPFGVMSTRPNQDADDVTALDPETYPYLTEMAEEHLLRPGYDFGDEFQLGLDLILGALAGSARAADRTPG
jgi:AcrR family transcriptional regulator